MSIRPILLRCLLIVTYSTSVIPRSVKKVRFCKFFRFIRHNFYTMSLLELDRSELERSLIINKDSPGDESISGPFNSVPTKLVTPIPGFCVKVRSGNQEKVFINVCHTEHLPKPIGFSIPMSIGNEREVVDKAGQPRAAFDVAINSTFFDTMDPHNEMMMCTIIEAVAEKHKLDLNVNEFHILKNIKCKGKIESMNIEQRSPKSDMSKKPLISEISSKPNGTKCSDEEFFIPDFNLLRVDQVRQCYASEIDLKNVLSKNEICLQLNEDRLYLTTTGKVRYELEYHFPEYISIDECCVEFDKENQILTIIAPVQN